MDFEHAFSAVGGLIGGFVGGVTLGIRSLRATIRDQSSQIQAQKLDFENHKLELLAVRQEMISCHADRDTQQIQIYRLQTRIEGLTRQKKQALVGVDDQGNIVEWSPIAEEFFGYREEDILGKPVLVLVPGAFKGSHSEGFAKALAAATIDSSKAHPASAMTQSKEMVKIVSYYSKWLTSEGRWQFQALIELVE